jgi:hypothetical protein
MTKYRKFLSFCTTLDRSKIPFSLYEFNYLHRNLTFILFFFFCRARSQLLAENELRFSIDVAVPLRHGSLEVARLPGRLPPGRMEQRVLEAQVRTRIVRISSNDSDDESIH